MNEPTRRRFSASERTALFLSSNGECVGCGSPLDRGWHADHRSTGWCLEQGDLTEPGDVDRLTAEAWNAIVLNYGTVGCNRRGDPADCLGPISGRYRWTPDDHRVIARAWERLADNYERAGETEKARRSREDADRIYAEADRLETGHDPSTTSTP